MLCTEHHRPTDSLVKEAYVGAPSRPIFPLVGDWAEVSNNAWVALEGKVRLIADVATHAGTHDRTWGAG